MNLNKRNKTGLSAFVNHEFALEIQALAEHFGVPVQKVIIAALELGVPMTQYKLAIDQVKHDRASTRQVK